MVWTIVTHRRPHLDEIVAIWLLVIFGSILYEGLDYRVRIIFWDAGAKTPDGRSWEEWFKDGFILVGVGGGEYDEHARPGRDRVSGECATTLVAKDLWVDTDPKLKQILDYASGNDAYGKDVSFGLASLIQTMYAAGRNDLEVIRWACKFLDAKYEEQCKFHGPTAEAFARAQKRMIKGPHGQPLSLVSIQSDAEMLARYAYSDFAGDRRADIFVQRHPNGHTAILPNKASRLDMSEVVRVLRKLESEKVGARLTVDWSELGKEGVLPEVPQWFYSGERGQYVLNGSNTAKDVPATRLSLDEILAAIELALDPSNYSNSPPSRGGSTVVPMRRPRRH